MMPQEAPDTSPKNSPAKILLVDDDEVLLAHIGRTLQNQGYLVESCEDAHQALLKIKGGGFDLLITDVRMPEASGTALAEMARKNRPSLPIVVISSDEVLAKAWSGHGKTGAVFIHKPFTVKELIAGVRAALKAGPPKS